MAFEIELPAVYLDAVLLDPTPARPAVINRDPEPGETQVPIGTSIALDLTDVGPDGIDTAATEVHVAGVLAFAGGVFQPGFDGPGSSATNPQPDTLRVVIDPVASFLSLQEVSVRVVSRTLGGAFSLDTAWTFRCEDLTAPRVVGAQARELRRVRVSFDEPIKQVDPAAADDALNPALYTFERLSAPAVDVAAVQVEAVSDTAVDVVTDTELTPGAAYRVNVGAVADLFGNTVASPDDSAVFAGFVPPRPLGRRFDLYQMLPFSSLQNVNVAVDDAGVSTGVSAPGNEKIVSVFVKFDRSLSDPRVDGNSLTVFFRRDESFKFIVVQGAEAPAGAAIPPPLRSDAILLADVTRSFGQTQILNADISTARRQDAFVVAGSPRSLRRGRTLEAISDLLGLYNAHVGGSSDRHPAASVDYAGGGAWADGTTNPATSVESQLDKVISDLAATSVEAEIDKIISDLAATSGAPKVGAAATAGTPNSLSAGSVKSQLDALLGFINGHVNQASGAHAAAAISYAGGAAWKDGTTNPASTVEAQLDKLVSDLVADAGAARIGIGARTNWLGGRTNPAGVSIFAAIDKIITDLVAQTANDDGAERIGTQAVTGSPNSLAAGSVRSQLDALLGLVNLAALVSQANTWAQTQTFAGDPGIQYPTTSAMRLLLYVPSGMAPLRIYADSTNLWITLNARWTGTQWQADTGGNFRSALRLYRTSLSILHQGTDPDTWTDWQYGLQLDLSATNKEFVSIGTSGLRQRAYTGQEGYCNGSSGAGGSWNYPFRFGAVPSSVTFSQQSKYPASWSTEPSIWTHDVMGGSWFGYPGAAGTFWYTAVVTAY